MAKDKEVKQPVKKVRAEKYEPLVKFNGTLEDMIKMAGNTKGPEPKK